MANDLPVGCVTTSYWVGLTCPVGGVKENDEIVTDVKYGPAPNPTREEDDATVGGVSHGAILPPSQVNDVIGLNLIV